MTSEEQYQLALTFRPFTEKHRVKRTTDHMQAGLNMMEYLEKIQMTLEKLQSGQILTEADSNVLLNINVPETSSLIRPHTVDRQWKIRNDEADRILRRKTPKKWVEAARAWRSVFTERVPGGWPGLNETPSEAWYRYFESVYRTVEEDSTVENSCTGEETL